MSFALYNLVVKLFLVTTLVVPGGQGLLQGQKLDDVKASYTQTLDRRQELVTQLHQHEESYRTLLRQVDVLKSGPNTLQNRLELEGLLRDSRQLAQRMQTLQKKIQAADTRLDNQRSQLVAAIDSRTEVLEKKLAKTAASERGTIVGELNELRADRQRFSEPLPSAPTDGEVSETLAMLDELDGASAEDLLAAADELQDTEDQVRKRLQAIEGRIKQLREAKMLARRAQTFATEESFFDETDRSRFIATYGDSATAGDRSGDGANEAPTVGDDSGGARDGHGEAGDEAESPQPGAGMDPSTDGDFNAGAGDDSDSLSDSPEAPPAAPEEPGDSTGGDSQDGDVFGAGDDLLIDGQTDPETSVGSGFESDYELNSRIQQLQREQKRLEEQARELEKKAGQLRKRAKDSLD